MAVRSRNGSSNGTLPSYTSMSVTLSSTGPICAAILMLQAMEMKRWLRSERRNRPGAPVTGSARKASKDSRGSTSAPGEDAGEHLLYLVGEAADPVRAVAPGTAAAARSGLHGLRRSVPVQKAYMRSAAEKYHQHLYRIGMPQRSSRRGENGVHGGGSKGSRLIREHRLCGAVPLLLGGPKCFFSAFLLALSWKIWQFPFYKL